MTDQWRPISEAPQDETVFLAGLWHQNERWPRWEYALLYWGESGLRFYDNETGWEPGEYTHCLLFSPPQNTERKRAA
jgi:hypothetical protein